MLRENETGSVRIRAGEAVTGTGYTASIPAPLSEYTARELYAVWRAADRAIAAVATALAAILADCDVAPADLITHDEYQRARLALATYSRFSERLSRLAAVRARGADTASAHVETARSS